MNSDNGKVGRRRVVVSGIGVVSPNGIGAEAFWQATKCGISGVDKISLFDPRDLTCQIAGEVKDFQPENYLTPKELRRVGRAAPLAIAATEEALRS
ncbi:MAG: beta-ketoacyl synthase N-terminal-like domain-containing protein, partial [Candidatus Binatia bacterium]